jgi:2-polyprenyl-3-methyl-5-hydroxy-6-metoxy-1,4-benzoquinol methylase
MTTEKRDFDAVAASWDEKPARVKLAGEVADSIIRQVDLTPAMKVADFGCGTGLLSLRLHPLVASITGIDSSPAMLDVFRAKIAEGGWTNIDTQLIDPDKGDVLTGSYDLIVSSMTLHHIREPGILLRQLYGVLAPRGILAIADLDPDGGHFHDDNTGVFHFGFDRAALRAMFAKAGFIDVRDSTATETVKAAPDGTTRTFSVFLISGRKG